ncbi:hypothetical protein [Streptomyces sp. NPDC006012]|uniref:hypothetical protein n=1 Tax=Streptomyces sp. NPDC006012 TaxID=3364739 RepID=UPI003683B792
MRALRDRDFTTVFALTHGVGPACLTADTAIAYLLDDAQPEIEPAAPAEQLHWRTGLFHRALESRPVILAA